MNKRFSLTLTNQINTYKGKYALQSILQIMKQCCLFQNIDSYKIGVLSVYSTVFVTIFIFHLQKIKCFFCYQSTSRKRLKVHPAQFLKDLTQNFQIIMFLF